MIKRDSETLQDWIRLDDENVQRICEMVRSYERDIQDYLAEMVAALCDLDAAEMMTKEDRIHCNHARWLFWYAYRHMTNDTFEHMSQITERYGRKYTMQGINAAVNKMSALIIDNTIWTKRWTVLKRIIKMRDQAAEFDFGQNQQKLPADRIYVNVPRELRGKVEIKYED